MIARILAPVVGSYNEVLEMPAEEALNFLADTLDNREIEAYKHSLLIWASRTANVSGEDAMSCIPKKPLCLCDDGWD